MKTMKRYLVVSVVAVRDLGAFGQRELRVRMFADAEEADAACQWNESILAVDLPDSRSPKWKNRKPRNYDC